MELKQNPFKPIAKKKSQDVGTEKNSKTYENDFGSGAGIGDDRDQLSKAKAGTNQKPKPSPKPKQ